MFQNNDCAQNQAHAILRALSAAAARTQRREAESEGRSLPSKVLSARQAGTGEMAPGCAHSPAAAEPSMAERAFFNNKCFKIITARRIIVTWLQSMLPSKRGGERRWEPAIGSVQG